MDLVNYAIHLMPAELDYELNIRGVFGLTNNRIKTTKLRELMQREDSGLLTAPKSSSDFTVESEILTCSKIFQDVLALADESTRLHKRYESLQCISRFLHIQSRLERLMPTDDQSISTINDLLDNVYGALTSVANILYPQTFFAQNNTEKNKQSSIVANPSPVQVENTIRNTTAPLTTSNNNRSDSDNFTRRISMMNFSGTSDTEGAVGGTTEKSPRESLSDIGLLSNEELQDVRKMLKDITTANINPFRSNKQLETAGVSELNTTLENVNIRPPVHHTMSNLIRRSNERRETHSSFPIQQPEFQSSSFAAVNQQAQFRNQRSVPIHQWKISFSGDDHGMHLYDFLTQLELFQRSENVSDTDMLYSIMHLLSGRAKLWYLSVFERFRNWEQVVSAMKREFLPQNYDYILLNDINNRVQKRNESFGEFITHMQALFKCLAIPLEESHKLFIVQKKFVTTICFEYRASQYVQTRRFRRSLQTNR